MKGFVVLRRGSEYNQLTAVEQLFVIPIVDVCNDSVFSIRIVHLTRVASNLVEFNPRLFNAFPMNMSITPMVGNVELFSAVIFVVFFHVDNWNSTFHLAYEESMRVEIRESCKTNPSIGSEVTLCIVSVLMSDQMSLVGLNAIAKTI